MGGAFDFAIIWKYLPYLAKGMYWTCLISGVSLLIAVVFGLAICLANLSRWRLLSFIAKVYIQVFRNIPRIVILIWIYYCVPIFLNIPLKALPAAIIAFGLLMAASIAEVFRSGILSVDKGEIAAARSLGLTNFQVLRKVILPQAIRTVIPELVNQVVITIKTTTIAVIIAVPELVYRAKNAATVSFRPIEIYSAMGVMYFGICFILSRTGDYLQRRFVRYR
jgi:His/Glu/Gln/Arg/opine family amino acid ABC transporter permease subunit